MLVAGLAAGMLGIGAGAFKVTVHRTSLALESLTSESIGQGG